MAKSKKAKAPPQSPIESLDHRSFLIYFLLLFCILLPLLWGYDIPGSSEAREAHVAWDIHKSGDWILPNRNGIVPSKPPLYHWIVASLTHAIGAPEVTINLARSVSLAAVIVIAILTLLLSQRCNAASSPLSIVILLSTYGFLSLGFSAMVDMTFALVIWISVFPALYAVLGNAPIAHWHRVWLFTWSGLAVLCKGPLGFVFSFLIVFLIEAQIAGLKVTIRSWLRPNLGWLLFMLVACSWYIAVMLHGSTAILERQIWFENVARFVGDEKIISKPFWYYIVAILRFGAPWSWLLVYLAVRSFRRAERRSLSRAILITLAILVAGLSLSSGKRHTYLLPLYPLVALYIITAIDRETNRRLLKWGNLAAPIVATFVSVVLLIFLSVDFLNIQFSKKVAALMPYANQLALPLGVSVIGLFLLLLLRFNPVLKFGAAATWSVAMCVVVAFGTKAYFKSFRVTADLVRHVVDDSPLIVIRDPADERLDPVLFYLGRRVDILSSDTTEYLPTHYVLVPFDESFYEWAVPWSKTHHSIIEILNRRERLAQEIRKDPLDTKYKRTAVLLAPISAGSRFDANRSRSH